MITRLASWCDRHRRRVLALWIGGLVAAVALSVLAGGEHRVDYAMPGSESAQVRKLFDQHFPERAGDAVYLVAHAPDGLAQADPSAAIARLDEQLADAPHVTSVDPPIVAPDGQTAIVSVQLDQVAEQLPKGSITSLVAMTERASTSAVQFELGGPAVQYTEGGDNNQESIGMVAALLILLVAFGSALAAGIPLAMALCGLGVGSALAMIAANVVDVPDWGSQLATMIGIGVGIDYALFIVTRYRAGLAAGMEPHDAIVRSMGTAGRAVVFAGGTVIVSLMGLGAMRLEYLWGAAVAMVLAVLAVMAAALTLLPAVLGFAGRNIDRLRVPGIKPGDGRSEHWAHWSRGVQRRPVLAGVAALAVLLTLAAPVFGMRFGYPDAGTGAKDLGSRKAFDLIEQGFGPGANGPLTVVVASGASVAPGAKVDGVAASVTRALTSTEGVAAVLPPMVDTTGTAAALTVVPTTGPQDSGTESLVHRLRDDVLPAATEGTSARAVVGGATALYIDEAAYEGSHLPFFIATVIVVSFVLLLCVFRSVLVALKAAVLNVLAISAAYGVIALASHGGWLGQLIGIEEPTPIPVFVPILMFALLFGLSMDYEVFLLSRIREEHLRGHRNSDAVAEGIASTARVITAAAAIMVTVFGAFVFADVAFMKLAGLGMATAVFVDATIVRMVLVPATMEVLGERNWWMPHWLDRILPNIDVEGDPIPAPATAPTVPAAMAASEAQPDDRQPVLV